MLPGQYEEEDMLLEDDASLGEEDDAFGEEPMGMEDDGAEEYGLSGGGGASGAEMNPTDQAFADSEMDIASAGMGPVDEMFGEARVGAGEFPMAPMGEEMDEFAAPTGAIPGAVASEGDPGKAIDMKEELQNFLQQEAKARRERAETFQRRGREYMKNGGKY